MESPLLTLVVGCLGVFFSLFAPVESQQPPPAPPPPPPAPPLSPPPPPISPPPPSPSPPPPPPPSPSPPPPPPLYTPPPRKRYPPPAPSKNTPRSYHNHRGDIHPPPPPPQKKLNLGKTIGLIFVSIVAIMQVCVVVFLVIKRRQLLKEHDGY